MLRLTMATAWVACLLLLCWSTCCCGFQRVSPWANPNRKARPISFSFPLCMSQVEGGDGGVSQALNLIHKGAKLFQELNSTSVNADEAEQEALEEEMELEQTKKKKQHMNATTNVNATRIDQVQQEMNELFQTKLEAFDKRARRTRILLLKKIAAWAFQVSDYEQKGKIDRAAFYSGTLLVHLHLAKYVGVAACQPPTREQVDELFTLADGDNSNYLDQKEFTNAVVVATAPITSRIAIYWSLLAILPLLVARAMGTLTNLLQGHAAWSPSRFQQGLAVVKFAIQLILSRAFFSILVPNLFGKIDRATRRFAYQRSQRRSQTNTSLWWLRLSSSSSPSTGDDDWGTWFRQVGQAIADVQQQGWGAPKQQSKNDYKLYIPETMEEDDEDDDE